MYANSNGKLMYYEPSLSHWVLSSATDNVPDYEQNGPGNTPDGYSWTIAMGPSPAPTVTATGSNSSSSGSSNSSSSSSNSSNSGSASSGCSNSGSAASIIVSGAGTSGVDGTYIDTGDTYGGYPVYSNGNYYLFVDCNEYNISATAGSGPLIYYSDGMILESSVSAWNLGVIGESPVPTVSLAGSSSGSSGSSAGGVSIVVSDGGVAAAMGTYTLTSGTHGTTSAVYTNSDGYKVIYSNVENGWVITDVYDFQVYYYEMPASTTLTGGTWFAYAGAFEPDATVAISEGSQSSNSSSSGSNASQSSSNSGFPYIGTTGVTLSSIDSSIQSYMGHYTYDSNVGYYKRDADNGVTRLTNNGSNRIVLEHFSQPSINQTIIFIIYTDTDPVEANHTWTQGSDTWSITTVLDANQSQSSSSSSGESWSSDPSGFSWGTTPKVKVSDATRDTNVNGVYVYDSVTDTYIHTVDTDYYIQGFRDPMIKCRSANVYYNIMGLIGYDTSWEDEVLYLPVTLHTEWSN